MIATLIGLVLRSRNARQEANILRPDLRPTLIGRVTSGRARTGATARRVFFASGGRHRVLYQTTVADSGDLEARRPMATTKSTNPADRRHAPTQCTNCGHVGALLRREEYDRQPDPVWRGCGECEQCGSTVKDESRHAEGDL